MTFAGCSIAAVNAIATRPSSPPSCGPSRTLRSRGRHVQRDVGRDHRGRCPDLPPTCVARLEVLLDLGLGYLSLGRRSTTLSPGEAQRLRIATELRSGLFGVVYVLDEPSAGLHPADAEPLLDVLDRLKASGNSLFVVEHDMDVVRRADWVVDIGPAPAKRADGCCTRAPFQASSRSRSQPRAATCSDGPSGSTTSDPDAAGLARVYAGSPGTTCTTVSRRPARRADGGDRRLRLGKVNLRHPGAGRGRAPPPGLGLRR